MIVAKEPAQPRAALEGTVRTQWGETFRRNEPIVKALVIRGTPVHDWSSHAADAFRGLAVRHKTPEAPKPPEYEYSYRMPHALDWMGA